MTMTELAMKIFICDSDPTTAVSQKYFLETHNHEVEVVDFEYLFERPDMDRQDIVILDIGSENPLNFPVLDWFIKTSMRPRLLITAFENQVFKRGDFLKGGAAKLLFKPFSPSDLLSAVTILTEAPHG